MRASRFVFSCLLAILLSSFFTFDAALEQRLVYPPSPARLQVDDVTPPSLRGLSGQALAAAKARHALLRGKDEEKRATAEAKNSLEAYILKTRTDVRSSPLAYAEAEAMLLVVFSSALSAACLQGCIMLNSQKLNPTSK
jgi:hypothetical protein